MRPVAHPADQAVAHRVEVDVIHMRRQIAPVPDPVLPVAPLPDAALAAPGAGLEQRLTRRLGAREEGLEIAPAQGEVGVAWRQGPDRVQVVGLDAHADRDLYELDLAGPTLLVIGSEHTGLARGVRRSCTTLARLVPPRRIDSLNASVAAGIALYEATVQRMKSKA